MNWQRLYATIYVWGFVVCLAVANALCWAVVIAGICRALFHLEGDHVMYWLWFPSTILITLIGIKYLPNALRKANMLGDSPKKFGAWFSSKGDVKNK